MATKSLAKMGKEGKRDTEREISDTLHVHNNRRRNRYHERSFTAEF